MNVGSHLPDVASWKLGGLHGNCMDASLNSTREGGRRRDERRERAGMKERERGGRAERERDKREQLDREKKMGNRPKR